jgi:hypothetical protein
MSTAEVPAAAAPFVTSPERQQRRAALTAWLALIAPGVWLMRALVTVVVLAAPALSPRIVVTAPLPQVAAIFVLLYSAVTILLLLNPTRSWPAVLLAATLLADACACGLVLGGDGALQAPAVPLVAVVIAAGTVAAGWRGLWATTVLIGVGTLAAASLGLPAPLRWSADVAYSPTLSVETSFADSPVPVGMPLATFPTTLSVETDYAAVSAIDPNPRLVPPVAAVTLLAIGAGAGVSLWRARRARTAIALTIVAAGRLP